jgi:hypothetical protein
MEYLVVLLAAVTALIAVADSRLLDPYFAFYEIVPGMGVGDAAMRGDRRIRAAIIRRFGYGFLLGIMLAAIGADRPVDALAGGVTITVLLLWPMAIHGLPRGKLRADWMLVFVYGAVLAAYVGTTLAGQVFFVLVAQRDVVGWIRDEALRLIFTAVLVAIAFGVLDRWLRTAERHDAG